MRSGTVYVRGGGEQGGFAAGAGDPVEDEIYGLDAARPVGRGGPAIVHDDEHGAVARKAGARAEDWASESEDDEGGGAETEQQEPPGGARRGLLAGMKAEEQADGREAFAAWSGRSDPEQPPEQGKGGKGEKDPGGGENHRAESEV